MTKRVIVEVRGSAGLTARAAMETDAGKLPGFKIDPDYDPVPISPPEEMVASLEAANEEIVLIRGEVEEEKEEELNALPNVIKVWTDGRIEPFEEEYLKENEIELEELGIVFENLELERIPGEIPAFDLETASPCPPTDCDYKTAKGTIADVAKYLRCDRLWAKGIRGQGIVIGICDSGVSKAKVPSCIGGWSPTPSYTPGNAPSNSHGTMCATDAVGMCPDAKILDIAVLQSSGGMHGLLSDAISAFQWALNQYKKNKTPQILSNSWGIFCKKWATDYATKPNHPFTKKVVEVINAGIIVTFAAGNCGSACPSGKCCPSDTGPGKSIWGANGHPKVITVGAANILDQWIGYTSQGPAALDPKKPDFCAPSHFKGASSCDNGTSAANPVCAGVIGLLKSHDPSLTQDKVKEALQKTAKDLCSSGWDRNSGHGMIQAWGAYKYLFEGPVELDHAMWTHGTSIHEEFPTRLKYTRRLGSYALFDGKPGTTNWFHYPIPTPVIVNNKRLRLDSVILQFVTDPDTYVTNVHVYDGYNKIKSFDGLALTGTHLFERFDILDKYVRWGIGISIGVRFGKKDRRSHRIGFISAGGDFFI